MGACCPGGNSKAVKKCPPPPVLLNEKTKKKQTKHVISAKRPHKLHHQPKLSTKVKHDLSRPHYRRHALNASMIPDPKSSRKPRFHHSKKRLAKPLSLAESETEGSGSGTTSTTSSEDGKTTEKKDGKTTSTIGSAAKSKGRKGSTIARPLSGLMANKVMSVSSMGVESFKRNLGNYAPTTPLVLLFTNQNDNHNALTALLESMSNKFRTAVFLKAPMEKNMVAQQRFNITNTPTWVAFKNHVPVGRVAGTNPADVAELVRVVFDVREDGNEGGGGGGPFTMFNPY